MARYCFALDLKNDAQLIERYKVWHMPDQMPEAVVRSIRDADTTDMEIWLTGNRMFMIMETGSAFSFEAKAAADMASEDIQAWESLMWEFQQSLPHAKAGEKWVGMNRVFALSDIPVE